VVLCTQEGKSEEMEDKRNVKKRRKEDEDCKGGLVQFLHRVFGKLRAENQVVKAGAWACNICREGLLMKDKARKRVNPFCRIVEWLHCCCSGGEKRKDQNALEIRDFTLNRAIYYCVLKTPNWSYERRDWEREVQREGVY